MQATPRLDVLTSNLLVLVGSNLLSFDAAAGCLSQVADTHTVRSTAFNRMQTAARLCHLIKRLLDILGSPADYVQWLRIKFFEESAVHFSRILPQVCVIRMQLACTQACQPSLEGESRLDQWYPADIPVQQHFGTSHTSLPDTRRKLLQQKLTRSG